MAVNDFDIEIPLTRKGVAWGFAMTFFMWIFVGILFPVAIWDFVVHLFPNAHVDKLGQIGDMFGAANAMFSSMAFFAAILTVMLQVKQMKESSKRDLEQEKLQVEEMKLANENLTLQRELMDREERKQVRSCLLKVNNDASHFVKFHHLFGVPVQISIPANGPPVKRLYGSRGDSQSTDDQQRYEDARLELQGNCLSVKLVLGANGSKIIEHIETLVSLSNTKLTRDESQRRIVECTTQLRQELEFRGTPQQ